MVNRAADRDAQRPEGQGVQIGLTLPRAANFPLRHGRAQPSEGRRRFRSPMPGHPRLIFPLVPKDVDARQPSTPRLRRARCQSAEALAKVGTRPGMTTPLWTELASNAQITT